MAFEENVILLVDDEQDAREFVKTVVEDVGDFKIVEAANGEEGLTKANEINPDLIILDVMMPVKDGFDTFQDLRRDPEMQEVPIFMLTGVSGDTGIPFSAKDMGEYLGKEPEVFIDKPVDPETLKTEIRKVFAGKATP